MGISHISATVLAITTALTSASVAKAADDVTVRLNWFAAGYTAPFYVGVEKGWYKDADLNVTVQEGQGSGPTAAQVAAGRTTFGFVSADALVRVASQGAPVKMVASLAQTEGDCVLVKEASGIKTPNDLEGRRYGSTAASSIGRLLPAYLKAANVDDLVVQRVSVDAANLYAGFIGGQYEGMEALSYDEPPRFEAQGIKVDCLAYADKGIHLIGPGIVTNLDMIKDKPDVVRRFVDVTLRSYAYSYEHPEEAAEIAKKLAGKAVEDTKISTEQLKIFAQLKPKLAGFAKAEDWQSTVTLLGQYLGVSAPDVDTLYTNEFLPK
ncbi:ABC transporter substrate-binding protein [Sinorhizobium sp. CB7]